MKQRKTRVQKLESELRQAKKCISDLDVIVHAQNFTLLKHDKELPAVSSDSAKLWKKVTALQESERNLNGTVFVYKQRIESIEQRILHLESSVKKVAVGGYKLCDLVSALNARLYMLEKSFWKRLTGWLFGKKVSAKCE